MEWAVFMAVDRFQRRFSVISHSIIPAFARLRSVILAAVMIRRLSVFFGVLIGAMWMGEVLLGNLGDTSVLGNLRTLHFPVYRVAAYSFVFGALAFTALAGFYTAYRTGSARAAIRVAIWSGLISGAITLVTLVGMTAVFLDALRQSPSDLAEFAKSGDQNVSHFLYVDALGGGLNHLWIGAGLGAALGSIGAFFGRPFYREKAHS